MSLRLMIMGTGSDVGKSLLVAGLARAYRQRGLKVLPFKPQNMSNNASVTIEGGEIGRAQALQARAAGVAPSVHMNPVLLKPETTTGAQIIVQGQRQASMSAREFFKNRQAFMPAILDSFQRLEAEADLVLVEGAGSPAEVNLRQNDLANMGFATAADLPAVLVGDINRGGVIAAIIGTLQVLDEQDRQRIKGFIINKFHGDPALFAAGASYLTDHTKRPCLGIVPHFAGARNLPAEDALTLEEILQEKSTSTGNDSKKLKIIVLRLPRIANFDDLDPLRLEPNLSLQFLEAPNPLPGDTDLVIIPGSKSTMADLAHLRQAGWDIDLLAHQRRGGKILGLCGGYQMLGQAIHDPDQVEGGGSTMPGLRLLNVETTLTPDKTLRQVSGQHCATGQPLTGYEIHLGKTSGPDCMRPFANLTTGTGTSHPDGAHSPDGRVMGTYLHGCFSSDRFRQAYLASLGAKTSNLAYEQQIEATLDALADHLKTHLDLDHLLKLAKSS